MIFVCPGMGMGMGMMYPGMFPVVGVVSSGLNWFVSLGMMVAFLTLLC